MPTGEDLSGMSGELCLPTGAVVMKSTCHTPNDLERVIGQIRQSELPLKVTWGAYRSNRSLEQNKLLWKWLDIIRIHIADSGGELFTAEDLHEWYKAKLLPSKVVQMNGEAIRCRSTTTKLNTKQMAEYLTGIERHAADSLHLILPMDDVINTER